MAAAGDEKREVDTAIARYTDPARVGSGPCPLLEDHTMSDLKFLGVCIVLAAVVVAASIVYRPQPQPHPTELGRYQMGVVTDSNDLYVFDTTTGKMVPGGLWNSVPLKGR
jgi:hypothetical protein